MSDVQRAPEDRKNKLRFRLSVRCGSCLLASAPATCPAIRIRPECGLLPPCTLLFPVQMPASHRKLFAMRSPYRFVITALALIGLSTFALGSTWSLRFGAFTYYAWTIDRLPSGGMVISALNYPPDSTPATLVVRLDDDGEVIWHSVLATPAGGGGNSAVVPS